MTPFLFLIPAFAVIDRWCGGGMGWHKSFRGRPIYYVALMIPWAFYFEQYLFAEILVGWCLWRWPAWKLLGGSLAPVTTQEVSGTIKRHCLIAGVAFICLGASLWAWLAAIALLGLWVLAASYLAVYNALCAADGEDVNWLVEFTRGGLFGVVAIGIITIIEVMP